MSTLPWYSPKRWFSALTPERPALPAPAPTSERFAFDAAARGPTTRDWQAPPTSADAEEFGQRELIRDRARDAERNIPIAARALRIIETKVVGKGCSCRSATGDPAIDKRVNALFDAWAKQASTSSYLDFYGLQRLLWRSTFRDGEALCRFRPRRLSDGLTVPMQLEMLEADHLDHLKNEELSTGARIVQGVEYDPIGRISAYWLWPRHPGDRSVAYFTGQSVRVPEAIIAHTFDPIRIGQSRGVSGMAPVLNAMRQHEKRREAERIRARAEACVFATIQGDNADGMAPDEGEEGEEVGPSGYIEDQSGNPVDRFSPGGIYNVATGHELDLHAPQPSGGYDTAIRVEERTIATGIGLMYEHFGDLSQVTWASYRVGDVVTRQIIDSWRETVLEPMFLNRVWAAFIETCIAAGLIPPRADGYPVRHHWPVHEEMDREGGAKADIAEMRSGMVSFEEAAERKGKDLNELIESHKRSAAALAAAGIVFDGNPWQVAAGGTLQATPPAPAA